MRVMIIGASQNPNKFGHRAVVAYVAAGHEVFPVHPSARTVAGVATYANVTDVPRPIDRASLYLPPDKSEAVLEALAERGDVVELWLNPGADAPDRIVQAKTLGLQPVVACSLAALHA